MSKNKFFKCLMLVLPFFSLNMFSQTLNETQGQGSGASITSGDYNTMYGDSTGSFLTSGSQNTFIGYQAGRSNTTSESVFIGYQAGYSNTTGFDNTFIGHQAGYFNVTAGDNTFIGTESGENNTTGYDNTFVGEESGTSNTTGYENTFIGEDAGFSNTTGFKNVFVGNEAGISSNVGYRNVGVGSESLSDVDDGHHNTAVGDSSGIDVGDGIYNTFVGAAAGVATEWADYNTFIGAMSGWDNNRTNSTTNANHNTYVGYYCGFSNREGQYNVGMGSLANFDNTVRSNDLFIGYDATPSNNNVLMLGNRAFADGEYTISLGHDHDTRGDYSIVMGNAADVEATGDYVVAIGNAIDVDNMQVTAIGSNIVAQNDGAILLGYGASSTDPSALNPTNNIAIGYNANVQGFNSVAIGNAATAVKDSTMVLGGVTHRLSVGIGTDLPNSKASLELADTDKGFKINSLTNTQRSTLGSSLGASDEGMMVYDNEDNKIYTWSGSTWSNVSAGDNLGNHTATAALNMNSKNINNASKVTVNGQNGVLFDTSSYDFSIDIGGGTEYNYGSVTDVSMKYASVQSYTGDGWVWGVDGVEPIAALNVEGKFQIANSLNIAGAYEFPITDGSSSQVLVTDGSGNLTWSTQTDNQEISLSGSTLSISGGTNTVDLSSLTGTDNQDLTLTGNTLSLTNDATTVDLSSYLDNTDNQELSLSSNTLSLSGGTNTIDLSAYVNTDSQNLTSATLSGNTLTIAIENGSSVSVDLSPILNALQTENTNQQNQINDILTRLDAIEACACGGILAGPPTLIGNKNVGPILYQNIPNPFNNTSIIKYFLPAETQNAKIIFSDMLGKIIHSIDLTQTGENELNISTKGLASGTYIYTLFIGNKKIDSKKMVIKY